MPNITTSHAITYTNTQTSRNEAVKVINIETDEEKIFITITSACIN